MKIIGTTINLAELFGWIGAGWLISTHLSGADLWAAVAVYLSVVPKLPITFKLGK